jgi:hypothetical protein
MKNDRNLLAFVWILLGIAGRLIPHPPNMTPMTSLSLFGGTQLSRGMAFGLAFSTMILSDIALAALNGGPIFGYWSIFTYSAFAAIIFAGTRLRSNPSAPRTLAYLLGSSLGFWIWTNFGIWLTGDHGMYARTFEGLVACYMAALPFLRNALVGDLAWGMVFFLSFQGVRKLAPRFGWSVQGA